MRTVPSYARHMVSEPSLTLLPPPPKPPTPPSTPLARRRRPQPQQQPSRWQLWSRIAVRDAEKFDDEATTVTVEQVIAQTPNRRSLCNFAPTYLYVVRYRDGSILIVNEDALSAMAGQALKQNARAVGSNTSVSTDTRAATDTKPTAA